MPLHCPRFSRKALLLAGLLVIPLTALLFAQWPLRDVFQKWSRGANDIAQIVFAVYMAVAVTAASISHSHMAAHLHHAKPSAWRAVLRYSALLVCVGPWAVFMLWAAMPQIRTSVLGLEKFSDTLTPGYFVIKLCLAVLLLLVGAEAGVRWVGSLRRLRRARRAHEATADSGTQP